MTSPYMTSYMASDRGGGTMEENLTQQLTGIFHKPLFQLLIDVQKSYNSFDRGKFMEILRGYGLGTNLQRL